MIDSLLEFFMVEIGNRLFGCEPFAGEQCLPALAKAVYPMLVNDQNGPVGR